MIRAKNILLLVAVAHLSALADEIRPLAATRTDRAIAAATATGDVQLAVREVQVEVVRRNSKDSKGALLIIFDSATGTFARRFSWIPNYPGRIPLLENLLSYSKVYVTSDHIVLFTKVDGGIQIRESAEKARSLDDAEAKALNDSVTDLTDYVEKATRGPVVSFDRHLGEDFSLAPASSFRSPTKLLEVSRRDGKWEITVLGRWKAKMVLTDKFEVDATERLK